MKKKYVLVVLLLLLSLTIVSCNKNVASNDKTDNKTDGKTDGKTNDTYESSYENKAISFIASEYIKDNNVVGLVLNDLNSEKIDKFKKNISIEEYGDSAYDSALFIPMYNNVKISVYRANFQDNELKKDELLYETKNKENYGFLLRQERPEGIPLIIVLEGNNISEEYYYSYNGKENNLEFEFIIKMNTSTQ